MLRAIFEYQFLRSALWAGLLSSAVCGIVGVVIVEKKLVMMSGGIAHTAYGGIGLGYLLGFEPIWGAFLFASAAAVGAGWIRRKGGARTDVTIGLFWSLGMALGILFIALRPGYPPDPAAYLFGSILSVTKSDLAIMLGLTTAVALAMLLLYNDWKAYLFDEEFAFILGIRTTALEYMLLLMVAMTVVVLIRVVGIILALALLIAPAASAGLLTRGLGRRMACAAALGGLFCLSGLWVSYEFDVASGAVIAILSAVFYLAAAAARSLADRRSRKTAGTAASARMEENRDGPCER